MERAELYLQAVRNLDDLECLSCPPKYRNIQTFYKYYSGEVTAPYPTLFIGGNHEASNHLWELYYGGWAAPNIYYLGHAGVVKFGGLRIGGLSGIFNARHYRQGHYERLPYTEGSLRSAYHVRELEVYRLKQLSNSPDVMLSHDWPQGIAYHGNSSQLFRAKPFLRSDIERGDLGSPPAMHLMELLRPKYWFSAHHHVKFAALVDHAAAQSSQTNPALHPAGTSGSDADDPMFSSTFTQFLALDKCLPGRRFLQVVDFPEADGPPEFSYDEEWLAILAATHNLLSLRPRAEPLPGMGGGRPEGLEQWRERVRDIIQARGGSAIPRNFVVTAAAFQSGSGRKRGQMPRRHFRNPQTEALLEMLGLSYNLEHQSDAAASSAGPPLSDLGAPGQQGACQPFASFSAMPLPQVTNPEEIDIGALEAEANPEEIDLPGV